MRQLPFMSRTEITWANAWTVPVWSKWTMDEGGGGGNGCIFDRPRGMPKAGFEMKSFTISKGSQK